jgi:CHASE3 domain sensor protein
MLAFVALLGTATYVQNNQLFQRTTDLYEHPLPVREAVDEIEINIMQTRVCVRDFIITDDAERQRQAVQTVESSLAEIEKWFDALYESYPGPQEDIDLAYAAFVQWKTATESRIDSVQSADRGTMEEIIESLGDEGDVGAYRVLLTAQMEAIHDMANSTADTLYETYISQYKALNLQARRARRRDADLLGADQFPPDPRDPKSAQRAEYGDHALPPGRTGRTLPVFQKERIRHAGGILQLHGGLDPAQNEAGRKKRGPFRNDAEQGGRKGVLPVHADHACKPFGSEHRRGVPAEPGQKNVFLLRVHRT